MQDVKFHKLLITINAVIPLGFLAFDAYRGALGANPIEFFLRTTGVLTLIFLFITLAVTPLRKIFGWNALIRVRRMLGLYAFFYALVHLVTYGIFDKSLDPSAIVGDVWQRPFIAVGMLAFLMLVPLAITSTNGMVKRLGGKTWSRLHKLTYVIAILGVIHFWMIVKSDVFYPAIFALVLAILLAYRVFSSKELAARTGGGAVGNSTND
ncbi:MAG TPA: protein-methionine-sulfoxide reductase heme-binding subunit MsrQ [Pyrinomonadaceae bacterium]|nr:protein-methionine-sulfoxide reductase heme-binding subunit MsrQ [Pyrinomonadaceae bacterium]